VEQRQSKAARGPHAPQIHVWDLRRLAKIWNIRSHERLVDATQKGTFYPTVKIVGNNTYVNEVRMSVCRSEACFGCEDPPYEMLGGDDTHDIIDKLVLNLPTPHSPNNDLRHSQNWV
jgi:hypothetical protein